MMRRRDGPGGHARHAGLIRGGGRAAARLLLNWAVLAAVVAAVVIYRNHTYAQARAPLPPPHARLTAAQSRQWRQFPRYHRVVPVLVYHGIEAESGNGSVTPRLFAEQMLALHAAGFHAITLSQYAAFARGEHVALPAKPILLTFDGGRLDTFRASDDILRNYGFHATMFTFAAWPTTHPGFNLTWPELRTMQESGIWSVQEYGGNANEDFRSSVHQTTVDITLEERQFAAEIPGWRPLAFTGPVTEYNQLDASDSHIYGLVLPWLKYHFPVIFGGDYLDGGNWHPHGISGRFSGEYSYRITMSSRITVPGLYCRLRDWVTGAPVWQEYRCLRPPAAVTTGQWPRP